MKALVVSFLLVIIATFNSFGQADGKWSVGVGATPVFDGLTTSIYINRHLGERWQFGIMPFSRFYKLSSTYTGGASPITSKTNSIMLGLNVNARYYITNKWAFIKPYVYGYSGYGETHTKYEYTSYPTRSSVIKFFNTSLGLGVQVPIGRRGWSLDGNFGYQGYFATSEKYNFHTYVYSFGVFKRFGKIK
jgi:hypothetical protein